MPQPKRRPDPLSLADLGYDWEVTPIQFEDDSQESSSHDKSVSGHTEINQSVHYREKTSKARRATSPAELLRNENEGKVATGWVPVPLRKRFWMPFAAVMLSTAIGFEVALHFSQKKNGWSVASALTAQTGVLHYVYTAIPSVIAAVVVACWAWTDFEIKRIQPYVDLIRGDSPPQKSLLLDYTRDSKYLVWIDALQKKHYLVALSSVLAVLLTLCSPFASSLFALKNVYWTAPPVTVVNRQLIGINPALGLDANASQRDLLSNSIVAAAGYAGAKAGFPGVAAAPFTLAGYTIGQFDIPTQFGNNGTISLNTTAVLSSSGCQSSPVNSTQLESGTWVNSATYAGCTFEWSVNKTSPFLYGSSILGSTSQCNLLVEGGSPFEPVAFWFFSYEPSAMAKIAFCNASIELFDVAVSYEIGSSSISSIGLISPLSLALYLPFIDGQALNGWALPDAQTGDADSTVADNVYAAQRQLPAAIFQATVGFNSSADLLEIFQGDTFERMADSVYTTFLALIARSFYFVDQAEDMTVVVHSFHLRLLLSPVATHFIAASLILVAVSATILHIIHTSMRRDLILGHQPGTIASAITFSARTPVGDRLSEHGLGLKSEDAMGDRLKEMRFILNPTTMKIVAEGEEEYEVLQREREQRDREAAVEGTRLANVFSPLSPRSFRSRRGSSAVESAFPGSAGSFNALLMVGSPRPLGSATRLDGSSPPLTASVPLLPPQRSARSQS